MNNKSNVLYYVINNVLNNIKQVVHKGYVVSTQLLGYAANIVPDQPAHPCSLTRPYTVGLPASNS
jgi:hypothetical protein